MNGFESVYGDIALGDRLKRVDRRHPCPFCQHEDWCCMGKPAKPEMPNGAFGLIFYCARFGDAPKGTHVNGSDGFEYVSLGMTQGKGSEPMPMFEEVSQYKLRHSSKLPDAGMATSTATVRQRIVEPEIEPLSPEELNAAYTTMISYLTLDDADREKLHKDGMTDEMIAFNMIVTLPEPDEYRFRNKGRYSTKNPLRKDIGERMRATLGGRIEGVPGAYYNSSGKATIAGPGGILYPQFDLYGNVHAMRVGVKRRWKDDKGRDITKEQYEHAAAEAKAIGERTNFTQMGKYMNLSSYKEDQEALRKGTVKNMYAGGCRSGNHLGFYKSKGDVDLTKVYITEGEKKAMIAGWYLHAIVIDVPGVSSHAMLYTDSDKPSPLAILKHFGTKTIVVAYDADKNHNNAVLRAERGLVTALLKMGFEVEIANWNESDGKGLDDLLVNGFVPTYEKVILEDLLE